MEPTWLVLDVNNLAYRSFYAMGSLRYEGRMTGMVFGVLRDFLKIQELHNTDKTKNVFCFDFGKPKRLARYRKYKSNRHTKVLSDEEQKSLDEFRREVDNLREKYLTNLGFKNILFVEGYEADDLIAASVNTIKGLPGKHQALVVSSDHDLYQLLGSRVTIWNPHQNKIVNESSFRKTYNVLPSAWPVVKAIAGCTSDCIDGVMGVGEKTACKYINGSLKPTTAAFKSIEAQEHEWMKNLPLVKLPYMGCPYIPLKEDRLSKEAWTELADDLGMRSLRNLFPGAREWGMETNSKGRNRK